MAETAGTLTTALSQRIRDPTNTAHDVVTVRAVLSYAQMLVNGATNADLLVVTQAFLAGQPLIALDSRLIRVNIVRAPSLNRQARRCDWRTLQHQDPHWFRRTTRGLSMVWDMVGRDLVLVWPQSIGSNPALVGAVIPTAFAAAGDTFALSDRYAPAVLDLAEQVLLLRQRLFASMKAAAEKFKEHIDARAVHQ